MHTSNPKPAPVPVDPKIWQAIIGPNFQIPPIHSRVYYFPQGHIEHASSPIQHLNPQIRNKPAILCRVTALEYLADPLSTEVYVKISLIPVPHIYGSDPYDSLVVPDNETAASFAKILTESDAGCACGFSVPRKGACDIYPPLNLKEHRPSQILNVRDVLGKEWAVRHVYRGYPKRHLLTRWSRFVKAKNLIHGDTVIFGKDSMEKLFLGIRRAFMTPRLTSIDSSMWDDPKENNNKPDDDDDEVGDGGVYARDGKGKVHAKDVCKAIELALQNKEFEVVYFPRLGWSNIVVKEEDVDKAIRVQWTSGMRVQLKRWIEDMTKTICFEGTVTSVDYPHHNLLFPGSPWRMLQVSWDDPNKGVQKSNKKKNKGTKKKTRPVQMPAERLSPWEVEPIGYAIPLITTHGQGQPLFPMSNLGNSRVYGFNPSLYSASMMRTWQDAISMNGRSNFDHFRNMETSMKTSMPTEPNGDNGKFNTSLSSLDLPGSTSTKVSGTQDNNSTSPTGESSFHLFDNNNGKFNTSLSLDLPSSSSTKVSGSQGNNSTRPTGESSFRLFGVDIIQSEQPVENESTEDEANNGWKEA